MEIVSDVIKLCFGVFLYSSHNVSVINCFLFSLVDLIDVCCSVRQPFLSVFEHSKLLYKLSPMLVMALINFLFSKLQNGLLFSQRQLSDLHVGLS